MTDLDAVQPPGQESEGRARVAPPTSRAIDGVVIDDSGSPVGGAQVTWTSLLPEWNDPNWRAQDWEAIGRATVASLSEDSGRFALERPEVEKGRAGERARSAVWVTAAGFEAAVALLADSPSEWPHELRIQLPAAETPRAKVVEGEGTAAAGATVVQRGSVRIAEESAADAELDHARRIFLRSFTVDDDGNTPLCAFPGKTATVAMRGELQSAPWVGRAEGDISLLLRPTFVLRGAIELRPGVAIEGDAYVSLGRFDRDRTFWIGRIAVRPDGTFGPEPVPIMEASEYIFLLLGGGLVSSVAYRPVPAVGADVFVTFDGAAATPVRIRVTDGQESAVPLAVVRGHWPSERASSADEVSSVEAVTDAEGRATVPCRGDGALYVRVEKRGWATFFGGPYTVPVDPGVEIGVVLHELGRIEGRVLHNGVPVPTFDIVSWQDDPLNLMQDAIEGSKDGSFVIADTPAVPTTLYASSPDFPRSEPVTVQFADGETERVTLVLPDGLTGVGAVIDAGTRAPLPGAEVQVYTNYGVQLLTPWGQKHAVGPDGRFRVPGLPPGRGAILVTADGYAVNHAIANGEPGQEVTFGTIPMFRSRSVCVQLLASEPVDFEQFRLNTTGVMQTSGTAFDERGLACVQSGIAGTYFFEVVYPDGSTARFEENWKYDDEWTTTHEVGGPVTLEVELESRPGCELEGRFMLHVRQLRSDGKATGRDRWFEAGEAPLVSGLRQGPITIDVVSGSGWIARHEAVLTDARTQAIAIELSCSLRCLRVVDAKGEPVAAAQAFARCRESAVPWLDWATTDANGEFCLLDQACSALVVGVRRDFTHFGIEVELAADPTRTQEIRLGPDAVLRARLVDGEDVLSGVSCWAEEAATGWPLAPSSSDGAGVVAWERVRESAYRLIVSGQSLWRTEAIVTASIDPGAGATVQVRRLGGLRLDVHTPLGLPAPGTPIELRSVEFDVPVSQWLGAGAIHAGPSGLATDDEGIITLDGLPRGTYRWSAAGSGGGTSEGLVEVPPGGTKSATILLP